MILNNTQANIFKVNGGIADNFANRPAASGSFYIFYSIDTQEIYYDNGAWVLIGSGGGGGGVNIYNSDGTLTSNRQLNGANNDLTFNNVNNFRVVNGSLIQLQTILNSQIQIINNLENDSITLSTFNLSTGIGHNLKIDSNKIFTTRNNNDIGLKLDFANTIYQIGQLNAGNTTYLEIDDTNELIYTRNNGSDIGYLLNFATNTYKFGQLTGGNQSILKIDDTTQIVNIQKSAIDGGIEVGLLNNYVRLGDWFLLYGGHYIDIIPTRINMTAGGTNTPAIAIDSAVDFIRSFYQSNNIGINLDFANTLYQFGQITGGNQTYLTIDDAAAYPVQLDGTNITSGTSGGVSGQHLKIKLNGVDYKIELRNP